MILQKDFSKITMAKFINCLCDGDFEGLRLISKKRFNRELADREFAIIVERFYEALGDAKILLAKKILKEISALTRKIFVVESSVKVLRNIYSKEFERYIIEEGYFLNIQNADKKKYNSSLNSIIVRLGSKKLLLKQRQKQFDEITKGEGDVFDAEKIRGNFEDYLAEFTVAFKVSFNFETMTVASYVRYYKKYIKLLQQAENGKGKRQQ